MSTGVPWSLGSLDGIVLSTESKRVQPSKVPGLHEGIVLANFDLVHIEQFFHLPVWDHNHA